MNRSRHGLKVLGLSLLAALGMTAFTAAGAQGSGAFLVFGLPGSWSAWITGEVENSLEGYFHILWLQLKIRCHSGSIEGNITNSGEGHTKISFTNCLVLDKNEKKISCELDEPIEIRARALVILHNAKPFILYSPLDGLTFSTVSHEDELCPLPEVASLKGSFVASISNPSGADVTKLISTKHIITLFSGHELKYGSSPVHLALDANLRLAGSHLGLTWGAI